MTASDFDAVVREKERIHSGVFRLAFDAPGFLGAPGQFLEMEPCSGPFPMTRRPLTINRLLPGGFEVVFEIRGRGTELLAKKEAGETVRTLGPLGRGWRTDPGRWLLIGGGMGAAGFPFLKSELPEPPMVLLGASSSARLLQTGGHELVATEDGSSGIRGLVTDLLPGIDFSQFAAMAVCGPLPMMRAVWNKVPQEYRHLIQVSTESRMGCGWGVCEGCSIPAFGGGYHKCCTDGPVFMGNELDWNRWTE
jgi:dihydroorotate dehydrogenase electron transfer subunit